MKRTFPSSRERSKRRSGVAEVACAAFILLLAGCAAPPFETKPWPGVELGATLLTPHYALHTDVTDPDFRRELARTMEATHALYAELVGPAQSPDAQARTPQRAGLRPETAENRAGAKAEGRVAPEQAREPEDARLDAYVFATRDEWAEHTRRTTGAAAPLYLLITRGGYAHERAFATFYFGDPQTLAACRHEGLHQYVAATFARRPPPFLEEGLATLFEEGFEDGDLARPVMNGLRHKQVVAAVRAGRTLPLATLLTMNAGDVVGADAADIDAFYAQSWTFARFLTSDRRYRDGLRRLLRAYADGDAGDTGDLMARHLGDALAADFGVFQRDLAGVD